MNAHLDLRSSNFIPRPTRLLAAAALTAIALSVLGCGGRDDGEIALQKAGVTLNSLGTAGTTPLPDTVDRKKKYESVITSLKSAADGQSAGRAAAARIMISRGHAGLGELAAMESTTAEGRWLVQVADASSKFDSGLAQQATAAALASYDPTKELADLDSQIRQREKEAADAATAKQQQTDKVNGIKAKADQARKRAQAERAKETEIRARAQGASQTTRAQILEEATIVKRRGDEFEKQAASFDADAAKEAPEVLSIQANIDKLNHQVEWLRQAKQALSQRADSSKAQSAVAGKEASDTFAEVGKAVAALNASRADADAAGDKALKEFQASLSEAKKASSAGRDVKNTSSILQGQAQQSIGDLHAAHYRSLKAQAILLQNLAAAKQAGVTQEQVTKALDDTKAAKDQARESYKAAMDLYSSVTGSPEVTKRIQDITDRLKKLAEESDKPVPEAAPADPKPADGDNAKPADDKPAAAAPAPADFDKAAVEAEVRDMVCKVNDLVKAGDLKAAAEYTLAENDDDKAAAAMMVDAAAAGQALSAACKDKFGKDLGSLLSSSQNPQIKALGPMLGGLVNSDEIRKAQKLDCKTVKIDVKSPTEAAVFKDADAPDKPSVVRKVDGRWLAVLGADPAVQMALQQAKAMKPMVTGLTDGLKRLADGVKSGKIADAAAFEQEITKEMMAAMMKAGAGPGKGNGGKGGGGNGGGGGGG